MEFWEDYETLRIETPEGLDLYLPLAGFGPRFLAFLIDIALVTVVQVLVGLIAVLSLIGFGAAGPPDEMLWLVITLAVLIFLIVLFAPVIYFMLFESLWAGQSPGKRVTGIRVIRRGGYPAGRREIAWRNVMRIVDYMPSNWMVGLVSFFATKNQQRIGDLLADTVVVREFAGRRPVASPFLVGEAREHDLPAPGTLTPQTTYVIQSYLQRAADLEPDARERLSLRCIAALGYSGNHLTLPQREGYLAQVAQHAWAVQG